LTEDKNISAEALKSSTTSPLNLFSEISYTVKSQNKIAVSGGFPENELFARFKMWKFMLLNESGMVPEKLFPGR
jgi:hypothetical protein